MPLANLRFLHFKLNHTRLQAFIMSLKDNYITKHYQNLGLKWGRNSGLVHTRDVDCCIQGAYDDWCPRCCHSHFPELVSKQQPKRRFNGTCWELEQMVIIARNLKWLWNFIFENRMAAILFKTRLALMDASRWNGREFGICPFWIYGKRSRFKTQFMKLTSKIISVPN